MDHNESLLGDALRQAVAQAPPTHIDVDNLMHAHRRSLRRRRWLVSAAGGLALVTMVAFGVAVLQGYRHGAPGTQVGDPGTESTAKSDEATVPPAFLGPVRTPTEPAETAMTRLDQAFTFAARALFASTPADQVPATSPELGLAGGDSPVPSLFSGAPASGYKALLTFTDAAGSSTLQVIIMAAPMPAETECAKISETMSCTLQTLRDGTKIYQLTTVEQGAATYAVEVYRPDGTHVWLVETNVEFGEQDPQAKQPAPFVLTRPTPLLDLVALVSLAKADTLTLFPVS